MDVHGRDLLRVETAGGRPDVGVDDVALREKLRPVVRWRIGHRVLIRIPGALADQLTSVVLSVELEVVRFELLLLSLNFAFECVRSDWLEVAPHAGVHVWIGHQTDVAVK